MSQASQTSTTATTSTVTGGYNGLIIEWLTDLRNQAKRQNSKTEFTYAKALKSVREHKEPLLSGAECKKLKGIGDKMCAMIEKKLKQHLGDKYVPPAHKEPASQGERPQEGPETEGQRQSTMTSMFQVRKRLHGGLAQSPTMASPAHKVARPNQNRKYIPAEGSSGFAILVALLRYELEYEQKLVNKLDLQNMSARYTTTLVGQGVTAAGRYAGWATIKTLTSRGLVAKTDARNSYYYLTESGNKLARRLARCSSLLRDFADQYLVDTDTASLGGSEADDEEIEVLSGDEATAVPKTQAQKAASSTTYRPFIFKPGEYELVLCIDSRERIATNACADKRAAFATALQKNGVRAEIRTLPLGDFVWVAREKTRPTDIAQFNSISSQLNSGGSSSVLSRPDIRRELVLDMIIERKRIDDLASSIKDRRWDEQKYRLLSCGIRRPMYLIEYLGRQSRHQEHCGLKPETLDQAITNCEIDGFDVKRTDSFDETVRYLTFLNHWLERRYADAMLMSCPAKEVLTKTTPSDLTYITFNEFATNSGKINVFTAKEMLVKQLLQVKGLSLAKVQAIVAKYPTLMKLLEAYDRRSDLWSKHNMLTDLMTNCVVGANRRLGPAISRKLSDYYTALK